MAGYKTVNLEEGLPLVDDAIRRLTFELNSAKRLKYTGLKLIHGYGSSGSGGRIRVEARKYLSRCLSRRMIKSFIPGESFSIFDAATRDAFSAVPELRKDSDLERHNNGVTIVIL